MRLLSLNAAHGARALYPPALASRARIVRNLEAIAELLRAEGADAVALQEIDRPSTWSGGVDQVELLRGGAGYDAAVHGAHRAWARPRLAYGTALLARGPLEDPCSRAFDRSDKGFVVAAFRGVDLVSLHLDPWSARRRARGADALVEVLRGRARPCVVMGDTNCGAGGGDAVDRLATALDLAVPEAPATYPAARPLRRLDWMLASRGLRVRALRAVPRVVSDHRAIVADVDP